MLKNLQLIIFFTLFLFSGLLAQTVILEDEFDNGDSLWDGWIDNTSTTVTVSIDSSGVLSGNHSYKLEVVEGGADTYRIQRNSDCPLQAGYQYTIEFMAVADRDVTINVLFEMADSPYTKYFDELVDITTTAQTFTYVAHVSESVPTNELKLHFGGPDNDNYTIWVDAITVTEVEDPTLVSNWGSAGYAAWPILNDSLTLAGDAGMGDGNAPTGWTSIRGEFTSLTPTTTEAVVVSGKLEYVGGSGGDAYTHLRYALTFQDSTTLENALTDSAAWISPKSHSGYGFHPRTGIGTMSNGTGGIGTVWTINDGNWVSTYSNNGGPIAAVKQQPRNAEMAEGVYDFAVSVLAIDDTTNEIRWYLVAEDNSYWFGGTVVDTATSDKFNGIVFGVNNDNTITQFNLTSIRAELADPIEVPEAPWEAYYVDEWGSSSEGRAWPILNDSLTLVGDAGMGDDNIPTGWATMRGGFGQDLPLKTDEFLIVSGQLEFEGGGGGNAYTHFRYAMTFQDSTTLENALTDSAAWTSPQGHYGYGFQPRTGTGTMANGRGGTATLWLVDGGGFNSGWGGNNTALVPIAQAPRNAEMVAGTYDFAIAVRKITDTESEIKWYLVEENNAYWFGGTVIDTSTTDKYNGICFGLNNDSETTQFNVIEAKIDYGDIEVPKAPWEAFFVENWGFIGDRTKGWELTPGEVTGNVSIGGTASEDWAAIRGGFGEAVAPDEEDALIVTGKMEFVGGGFEAWSSLRMGIFYSDSAGTLVDSTWDGTENNSYGYLFLPHSGTNDITSWANIGTTGSVGAVNDRPWLSTNGDNDYVISQKLQQPAGAVGVAGEYEFAFSIAPQDDGTQEIRWYVHNDNYAFGGGIIDDHDPLTTTEYNSFNIAINNSTTTALNLEDVKVDMGDPIDMPDDILAVEPVDDGIPTEYNLSQNYPNPFNPTTTIEFALPKQSDVSIVVYDILGSKVTDLVSGNMNAGYYKINFDASHLASGVYFYSIKAGDFVSVKKLMLLK